MAMDPPFLLMPELVRDGVLRYLSATEFLSLRRVCKTTKGWVEQFSAARPKIWENFSLTIEPLGWKTFDAAVEIGLPISSFFLDNPANLEGSVYNDLYSSSSGTDLYKAVCPSIKKLRVRNFFTCDYDAELEFFEAMTSLEELRLDRVDTTYCFEYPKFPKCFQQLKSLKLGVVTDQDPSRYLEHRYQWNILHFCPRLEVLGYPGLVSTYSFGQVDPPGNEFQPVMHYIERQEKEGLGPLKYLDLKSIHNPIEIENAVPSFVAFLEFLRGRSVKLLNVETMFTSSADPDDPPSTLQLYECIQSVQNSIPNLRVLELNGLEKLSVDVYRSSVAVVATEYDTPAVYPKLRKMKINFEHMERPQPSEVGVVHWLIRDYERPSVEKLILKCDNDAKFFTRNVKARQIVQNFPNLISLKLVKCELTSRAYLRLWAGLPLMEKLWIEDCASLGNVALVGENIAEPVFLKLTRLRQFTLKLDSMSKLSDGCFLHVFRHMELTKFVIKCTRPLKKITERGILYLLDGKFADSIQKFSIDPPAFPSMSTPEFQNLIRRFRSIC